MAPKLGPQRGPVNSGSVGPGGSQLLLYVGPKSGSVGCGGTRWVPALLYVGPYTPFGFYNAN